MVVGILTGVSGPDASVLAAVLPATLTAAGTVAAYLAFGGGGGERRTRAISSLIILFSAALLAGTYFGSWFRNYSQDKALDRAKTVLREEQKQAKDDYIEELKSCTILELQINEKRRFLELPELTIWQVCPILKDPQSTVAPPSQ